MPALFEQGSSAMFGSMVSGDRLRGEGFSILDHETNAVTMVRLFADVFDGIVFGEIGGCSGRL